VILRLPSELAVGGRIRGLSQNRYE
jgi:hypothetical protein